MRSKIFSIILSVLLAYCLFAQEKTTRKDFFKGFYGTYFKSSGIEISQDEIESGEIGLEDVIKQLEARYNVDIPEKDELKFKTVEEVVEYVNKMVKERGDLSASEDTYETVEVPDTSLDRRKRDTWTVNVFASYGLLEPLGLTGDQGWDGNIFGAQAFNVLENMGTFDAGIMFHPYSVTKKEAHKQNSLGLAFDYSSFSHWGPTSVLPGDTTATRWGVSLLFRQDITGKKQAWPETGIYIQESIKVSVHDYGYYDDYIQGNNYVSYGLGLTEGIYVSIFDIKLYQTIAYSPGLHAEYPSLGLLDFSFAGGILDYEIGIRVGIAIKI